jgi:hypothetical protein
MSAVLFELHQDYWELWETAKRVDRLPCYCYYPSMLTSFSHSDQPDWAAQPDITNTLATIYPL